MDNKHQKRRFRFTDQDRPIVIESLNAFYKAQFHLTGFEYPEIHEMISRAEALPMQDNKYELWLRNKEEHNILRQSLYELYVYKRENGKSWDRTWDIYCKADQAPTADEIRKERVQQSRGERV